MITDIVLCWPLWRIAMTVKHKKQRIRKAHTKQQKRQPRKKQNTSLLRRNLLGLILTVITGLLMPLYFQHQGDIALSHVENQLATVTSQQNSLMTQVASMTLGSSQS